MPLIVGGGTDQDTTPSAPRAPRFGGSIGVSGSSVGKISVGVSEPGAGIVSSVGNIVGTGTALGKAVASGLEGAPIVGPLLLKPAIGAVGGVADATIGKILPSKIETKDVEEFAKAPTNLFYEALTGPSQTVSEAVLRARIQNTLENKFDIVSLLWGNAPDSVVAEYRRGATISEIAENWVNKFGEPGSEKYGAFSENGVANFLWTAISDPLNLVPVGKPFQLAARASTISRAGGLRTLIAGRAAAKSRLSQLIASNADQAAVDAQRAVVSSADDTIKFFNRWEIPGKIWGSTFGRIGDLKNRFVASALTDGVVQAWSRTVTTKGGSWAMDRLSKTLGEVAVKKGVGDIVLTTANAAKAELVQVATQTFRNRYDETARNIVKRLHELVTSGKTIDEALDTKWGSEVTIRQVLTDAKIPAREIDDLTAELSKGGLPEYGVFSKRPEIVNVSRRLGSSISNAAVARDPEFLLRVGEAQGGSNLQFATDAAVDVLSRDRNTIIRYSQNEALGKDFLVRNLRFGWGMSEDAARAYADDAFKELGIGSRELQDVIDLARMKAFGSLIRATAFARNSIPKTFAEVPETISRRSAIAKAFFPGLAPEEASAATAVLDQIARGAASRAEITIEDWYARNTFGINGVSLLDDAVAVSETLNSTLVKAKSEFANASPEEIISIAERIQPTPRMVEAANASGVKELSKKSPVELVTFEGSDIPFALPGGLKGLDSAEPFGLIDEVIIQSQPAAALMPGDIRIKIYKKIWASKGVDFQNPIEVANRVAFGLLSANTGLTPNAALYTVLRVRSKDDLAELAARWGDDVRSGLSATEIGTRFKNQIPGVVEKKFPTSGPKEYRGIEISEENIGRAIKALVFANDNPSWFTMRAGETPELLAERLTLLPGAGTKVGTFAVEVMDPSLSRGAIDRQMSAYVFEKALESNQLEQLVSDIFAKAGTLAPVRQYVLGMLEQVLPEGRSFTVLGETVVNGTRKAGSEVAGYSAPGVEAILRKKGWNIDLPPTVTSAFDELPDYMKNKVQTASVYKGSVSEVMNTWVDKLARSLAKEYPGIEDLSGAQKQWFLWDLKRGNIEPHSWINRGVDAMERPSAEQIGTAVDAITTAAGQRQGLFRGVSPEILAQFFQKRGEDVLGTTSFTKDGQAMIQLFKGADVQTALHEVGHVARRQLSPEDNAIAMEVYGVAGKAWTREAEEQFADDFTKYLYTGVAPIRDLEDVFFKIRSWLSNLWSGLTNTPLKTDINPRMKEVFDRLFITNDENLVAPTADFYSRTTILSQRTLTQNARREILDKVELLEGKTDGGQVVDFDAAVGRLKEYDAKYPVSPDGGATYNPIRGTAKVAGEDKGFAVAVYSNVAKPLVGIDRDLFFSNEAFRLNKLKEFAKKHQGKLRRDGNYIGIYDNAERGILYLDISRVYNTADDAIRKATGLGEESIFSLKNYGTYYMDTPKGVAAAAGKKASVTTAASQIDDLASLEISTVAEGEALDELRSIAANVVNNFDEAAIEFYGKPYSWDQVISWIKQHPEIAAREMNEVELQNLPDAFKELLPALDATGLYRFGVAPENGVIRRLSWVSDQYGQRYLTRQASPFVDTLDHVQVSAVDARVAKNRVIPNSFDRLADKLRKYGPEVVRNNYIQRFVTKMTAKGISVREAEQIMLEVSNLAYKKETSVQGLWFEQTDIEKIFERVLGRERFEQYIATNRPINDILEAAAGDVSVVGLTTGFTGRAKAWRPVIGAVANRLYPLFRFGKGNPIFQRILEPIETRIMKLVDDVRVEYRREWLETTDSEMMRKMFIDNRTVNTEVSDGLYYNREAAANATLAAAQESKGFVDNVNRAVRNAARGAQWNVVNPLEYKRVSMVATANQLANREWYNAMSKYAPEFMPLLAKHWGVNNADDLTTLLLEDIMVAANPAALEARLGAEASKTAGLYAKALTDIGMEPSKAREIAAVAYGVWSDSLVRATRIADKMQYFASQRSWFERSINHPVLGIYPYSYMTQKAIPAVLTLMFAPRINGWVHPGLGFVNYTRFKEMVVENAESNEDFISAIVRSPELGYALNIMIPAMPENLGFSAPGWIRRSILRPALQGQGAQLSKAPEELAKSLIGGTFIGQAASFGEAFESINNPLSKDIKEFSEVVAEGLQRNLSNR